MVKKKSILSLFHYNEVCERFSLSGLRPLLYIFLRGNFKIKSNAAYMITHGLLAFQYSVPLFIGILANVICGEFVCVITFSVLAFIGSGILTYLTLAELNPRILFLSLFLISFGIGALKPIIFAAHLDEDTPLNHQRQQPPRLWLSLCFIQSVTRYCIILSAFWSPIFIEFPCFGKTNCYLLSFSLGALLMGAAVFTFVTYSVCLGMSNRSHEGYLSAKNLLVYLSKMSDTASPDHETLYTDLLITLQVLRTLLPFVIFWMLYDQQFTSWIEQALSMNSFDQYLIDRLPHIFTASENVIMMVVIPLFVVILYPAVKKVCKITTMNNKIYIAMAAASLSYFYGAFLQYKIEFSAHKVGFYWQIPQFIILIISELILGMTETKFLHQECPERFQSVAVMLWLFLVGVANFFLLIYGYLRSSLKFFNYESNIIDFFFFGFLGLFGAMMIRQSRFFHFE